MAKHSNPFQFKHISNLKSIQQFDDVGPCVMMASPGMLQSGLSRELLELWCVDKRNGVIIPGYVVEGTLGRDILSQPSEIPSMAGGKLKLNLTVEYISFSAHVDYKENSDFIQDVGSSNLVLVHGDANEMGRLRSALASRYAEREIPLHIHTPRNCETVELHFRGEKTAKVIGCLAHSAPEEGTLVEGVLASKDFTFQIIAPTELVEFTELVTAPILQKMTIVCHAPPGLIKWHLEQMYGTVQAIEKDNGFKVFDAVVVVPGQDSKVALEWDSDPINDMIADSVIAVILQASSSPASVKGKGEQLTVATKSEHSHSHGHDGDSHDHAHEADQVKIKKEPQSPSRSPTRSPSRSPTKEPTARSPVRQESTVTLPQDLKKTPSLQELVHNFLVLQFGEDRVVNLTPLGESADTTPEQFLWNVNVDTDQANISVQQDASDWDVECASEELKRRLLMMLARIMKTYLPLSDTWVLN
ncbi:hypothetical protein HDU91_007151 [Kappamyces sp. JEL0680]|nr:hypothetical protein HDU91_007151 [Kappamyces sp. JEL0680]